MTPVAWPVNEQVNVRINEQINEPDWIHQAGFQSSLIEAEPEPVLPERTAEPLCPLLLLKVFARR